MTVLCPCHSNLTYEKCCQPFIEGQVWPPTAHQLMRSRYTAYTKANVDYIAKTMKGAALNGFNKVEAKQWAQSVEWLKLEVLDYSDNTVSFIASYQHAGQTHTLAENSLFKKHDGLWYYIGEVQAKKIPRNAPCPCGSQKKYKRCCGKDDKL